MNYDHYDNEDHHDTGHRHDNHIISYHHQHPDYHRDDG